MFKNMNTTEDKH